MRDTLSLLCTIVLLGSSGFAQQTLKEPIDTAAIRKIWNEGTTNSQVMSIARYLTDNCGPRLTGSPQYMKAANWSIKKLKEWGVSNAHLDGWGPFGKSWTLKRYSAHVTSPDVFPLLSFPKAWSPSTRGSVSGDVILFDASTDSALATYKGKLKGKFVLLGEPRKLGAEFEPRASRYADSTLLELTNTDGSENRVRRRFQLQPQDRTRALFENKKMMMLHEEGAHAILTTSRGDGGTIFVQQATVPSHPDTPWTRRTPPWSPNAPKTLPQIAVAAEHYGRLYRLLKEGERVQMELSLDVTYHKADSAYNVIAEIPGTDLADEVVMIGAHLDSWHGGTGATDNATGSAVCLEAMRIIKALDLKPRRTIRIGLWAGEEQGLLGARAYVRKYLGEPGNDSTQGITLKPAAEKFSAYFNDDNGTGRFRGIYMQGNEAVRPIFRQWLSAIGDPTAQTLTIRNTGSTDHVAFDQIGLPAFQFIQDQIEYSTLTHHSTMDVFERIVEDDLKQSAVIMAIFAYNAAMRDQKLPRKGN